MSGLAASISAGVIIVGVGATIWILTRGERGPTGGGQSPQVARAEMSIRKWYRVTWDSEAVSLDVAPPGSKPWKASFPWSSVSRVCFKGEGLGMSDGIYVFTRLRPESFVIPVESSGGQALWEEILRRRLFDAELAIQAAIAEEGLFCWPPPEPSPERDEK
jgi:hypothetical protein